MNILGMKTQSNKIILGDVARHYYVAGIEKVPVKRMAIMEVIRRTARQTKIWQGGREKAKLKCSVNKEHEKGAND